MSRSIDGNLILDVSNAPRDLSGSGYADRGGGEREREREVLLVVKRGVKQSERHW